MELHHPPTNPRRKHGIVLGRVLSGAFGAPPPPDNIPWFGYGLGKYVDVTGGLTYMGNMLMVNILKDLHPGDANMDTKTDVRDLNIWNANKFQAGTSWHEADFTGNGKTDVSDFNVWMTNRFTSAPDGVPGNEVPNIVYDAITGKLTVTTDGANLFSLIVPGPHALSIDDWQADTFKYGVFWTQAYFDGKEQWAGTNMKAVQEGTYQIATYAPGLRAQDFGQVEYGRLQGDILYTNVEVIPEPATLVMLLGVAVAGLLAWRRRKR